MFEKKKKKEWVKENMYCVKTENCLNHDCNLFVDALVDSILNNESKVYWNYS